MCTRTYTDTHKRFLPGRGPRSHTTTPPLPMAPASAAAAAPDLEAAPAHVSVAAATGSVRTGAAAADAGEFRAAAGCSAASEPPNPPRSGLQARCKGVQSSFKPLSSWYCQPKAKLHGPYSLHLTSPQSPPLYLCPSRRLQRGPTCGIGYSSSSSSSSSRSSSSGCGGGVSRLAVVMAALLALSIVVPCAAQTDPQQVSYLLEMAAQLGGDLGSVWSAQSDPCGAPTGTVPWQGVRCNNLVQPATITDLELQSMQLAGTLPSELFEITTLTHLDLSVNRNISGTIPESISKLSNLAYLDLHECSLRGAVPASIGGLSVLSWIAINDNLLEGQLPDSIANALPLFYLDVVKNHFSGSIPSTLSQCTKLGHLHMSNNQFTSYPTVLSRLPELIHLNLDNNLLNMSIDLGVPYDSNLEIIKLTNNSVYGTNLTALLSAKLLELVGQDAFKTPMELPDFTLAPRLQIIDLGGNSFYGPIPSTMAQLQELLTLRLGNNEINGSVPRDLTNLAQLQYLGLEYNRLEGQVPVMAGMTNLANLDLQNNSIESSPLSNLGSNITFVMHLYNTPACVGADVIQCAFFSNIDSAWAAAPLCNDTVCEGTAGQMAPNPVDFELSRTCSCAAPLHAYLLLKSPAFSYFNPALAREAELRMWNALAVMLPGLVKEQIRVVSVKQSKPGVMLFALLMDFFPAPARALDQPTLSTIKRVLNGNRSLLGDPYGPVYVDYFEGPATVTPTPTSSSTLSGGAIAGIVVGVTAFIAVVAALISFFAVRHYARKQAAQDWWSREDYEALESISPAGPVQKFTLDELKEATACFSTLLGKGGYGEVYRGTLPSTNQEVAVKRAKPRVQQGGQEFRNEIELLSCVRHRNLVGLVGFCREAGEQLLVYEFVARGTLYSHLHGDEEEAALTKATEGGSKLSWEQRVNIALGAARGLAYLHTEIKTPIVHRDIKTANILVDDAFEAKVADFGLSRLVPEDESGKGVETAIRGTAGYLDPDYYLSDLLTEKSDVYSFGVVLLELATGRRVFDNGQHIRAAVQAKANMEGILSVVDPTLVRPHTPHANGNSSATGHSNSPLSPFSGSSSLGTHSGVTSTSTWQSGTPSAGPAVGMGPGSPFAEQFEMFLRLAMHCCCRRPSDRPPMPQVVVVLSQIVEMVHQQHGSRARVSSDRRAGPAMSLGTGQSGPMSGGGNSGSYVGSGTGKVFFDVDDQEDEEFARGEALLRSGGQGQNQHGTCNLLDSPHGAGLTGSRAHQQGPHQPAAPFAAEGTAFVAYDGELYVAPSGEFQHSDVFAK